MSDPAPEVASATTGATLPLLGTAFLTFLCYLTIGLPLAVLPSYVRVQLGFGPVLAGLAISVQYLATLLSRPQAGRMADAVGSKQTVLCGLAACAGSGLFLLAALAAPPLPGLGLLLVSRLVLGFGESWVGTGCITWGIGRVGSAHTARMISWNGIASYGALALGAPVGVALAQSFGFAALGLCIVGLGVLGFGLAWMKPGVAVVEGGRMSFGRVFRRVLPYGLGLAFGSIGFGTISTFVTLFYAAHAWPNAAAALSLFGLAFVGARLAFAGAIGRFGGYPVAMACFTVEAVGLLLLGAASVPAMALVGSALAGAGFSLVFPALGVEGVTGVPAASRGAALGAYTVFLDLSLGVTGPLAGVMVDWFGYAAAFLMAAGAAWAGLALTVLLRAGRARARPA